MTPTTSLPLPARSPSRRAAAGVVVLALALSGLGTWSLPASASVSAAAAPAAAAAKPPVPTAPAFTSTPEALAPYQAGDRCDPVDKPGAVKLANLIRATYGNDQAIGISRAADCSMLPSEHAEGRAVDWMLDASNPSDFATAKTFLRWLLANDAQGDHYAMARRLGVMYIIWNRRMWRAYDPARGWAPYTGSASHTDHIHISLSLDGATGRTSYWTDQPLGAPCRNASLGGSPAPTAHPAVFVPVDPTRVLVTSSGKGTADPRSACRLWSGTHVDASVRNVPGAPATGLEAVALAVTAGPSNSPASVTAGPAGASAPGVRRLTLDDSGKSSSLLVVPVGSDGRVSFWTSRGATDLSVSVVGFYVDASTAGLKRATSGTAVEFHRTSQPSLLDGVQLAGHATRVVDVGTLAGVPAAATAAVVTLTARSLDSGGSVAVSSPGGAPLASPTVSVGPGQRRTVTAMVPIGPDGRIDVVNRSATAKIVGAHLVGFYAPSTEPGGLLYRSRVPRTVVSTAQGVGLSQVAPGTQTIKLGRAAGASARVVVLQVTVTGGAVASRLGFYDPDGTNPRSPDLSVGPHETVTTTVVAPISAARTVALWDSSGHVRMTASLIGIFGTP